MNKNFSQLNKTPIKLSPSDLTFLFDDCKRCFYEKVKNNNPRPSTPFPKMFNTIDNLMKLHYEGKSTKEISRELEEGHLFTLEINGLNQKFIDAKRLLFKLLLSG